MDDRPKFFYITYPMPIEAAEEFPLPVRHDEKPLEKPLVKAVPLSGEEDFVPQWYGNARFPEDE